MKFIEKNPNRKVIAVDLDNTLTNGEKAWEIRPTPHEKHIDIVRKLYRNGYIIIIHTARMWEYAPQTVGWIIENKIPFHGIVMGKLGGDFYIDDKNSNFENLKQLCYEP